MASRSWAKALSVNLAVIAFTLAGAELYFHEIYFGQEPMRETEYSADNADPSSTDIRDLFRHSFLGWAPRKGRSFVERTRFNNELLYEMKYTIDEYGLRVTAPSIDTRKTDANCVLFFGDSFTFGEGVNDAETMPYRVAVRSNQHFQTYNFGFLGYGPHQMLAQLQQGLVDEAILCTPVMAIYQALPGHVSRATGLEAWDQSGPKYVPGKETLVVSQGRFSEEKPHDIRGKFRAFHRGLPVDVKRYLEKSALYRALLYMHRPVTDDDLDIFIRIVVQSRRVIESRYPDASFHVVFWDFSGENSLESKIIEGLKRNAISVHLISTILPEYRGHEERFKIHPADGHPNPLAHDLIANYIVKTLLTPTMVTRNYAPAGHIPTHVQARRR